MACLDEVESELLECGGRGGGKVVKIRKDKWPNGSSQRTCTMSILRVNLRCHWSTTKVYLISMHFQPSSGYRQDMTMNPL